ncbi:MAG: hypothetical protein DRO18_02180 [Thermoprotei archaeon]|nr:MAG: hypothetical protein DRO18_02180 [Thermoprotei archaeon]
MTISKSLLVMSALFSFILGLLYVISGAICMSNWITSFTNIAELTLFEDLIPPDPWLGIVLISIGLTLTSSTYYLMRNNLLLTIASLLIGGGLAVIVMAIQLLATLASFLDTIITGEGAPISTFITNFTRVDALLGYLALPSFILGYRSYRSLKVSTQR